jgi:hypothetical protein
MPRADDVRPQAAGGDLNQGLLGASVEAGDGGATGGDGGDDVLAWLSAHSLERYHSGLAAQGYDRLAFLHGVKGDELSEVLASLKMKPPHERAFKAALGQLHAQSATVVVAGAVAESQAGTTMVPVVAIAPPAPAGEEPLALTTVAAHAVVDNIRVGQTAWLRVPSGPWINKWVPCGVLARVAGGGHDVRPDPQYLGSSPDWENSRLGRGFKNRQHSDLRAHLQAGMLAANPGRKWVAGEKFACPACGGVGIKKQGAPAWFLKCPGPADGPCPSNYLICAADRDGNDARIVAAETNARGKQMSGGFVLVCAVVYVYLRIWAASD